MFFIYEILDLGCKDNDFPVQNIMENINFEVFSIYLYKERAVIL